jgi:putative tributyrin esterase
LAILTCEYYSDARRSFQSFNVILTFESLPDITGKAEYTGGPYKTIYLLHGFSGSRNDWLRNSHVEIWAKKYHYAVVMPDGANYFYLDNEGTGERYGAYVGEELVSVTRLMFPLSQSKEDTVIAGLSMGGFGALRNGFRYADTFGAIVALSPALITDEVANMKQGVSNPIAPYGFYRHTFGNPSNLIGSDRDPKYLSNECRRRGTMPRLFLACGTEDFLFPRSDDFHAHLNTIKYPHVWWQQKGNHDFSFWNKAMPAALDWLTGNDAG